MALHPNKPCPVRGRNAEDQSYASGEPAGAMISDRYRCPKSEKTEFDSETIIRIKEGRGPPGGRCLDLGFVEVLVTGKYPESLVITRTNTESGGVKI